MWASTGHELGVLDVASGRRIAALSGTASIGGVDRMTFLGARTVAIDECKDDSPLRFGARDIAACGVRHNRSTLAGLPDEADRSGGAWPKPGTDGLFDFLGPNGRRTALGAATIGIAKTRGDYESIAVENARGELTALLASQATRDGAGTRVSDRAQLRSESMVEPSPDGSRFLIASRGMNGALQLWCTPTTAGIEAYPAEPARPDVLEIDGITEIAVAGFPGWVQDVVETREGLLILGSEVSAADAPAPPTRGLWTYDPATRKAARLELPAAPAMSGEGETWERFDTDPGETSIWLLGKHHIARRETDGGWSVFSLPPGTSNQVAAIGDRLAVHVGFRICNGGKPCVPGAMPSCFDVTLIGAVPASAAGATRTFDTCVGAVAPFPGGFVALGGAEVGFRDGRWVGARDPLVAAATRAHASDGFGRGDELVLGVERTRLDVLGLVDGRPRRTIALPFGGRASPVAASPGHAVPIWIAPDAGEGALVDVDPSGKVSVYGRAPAPTWAVGLNLRPRGGTRTLWWYGGAALISFDTKRWTAVFNPIERARLLVSRRVGY